MSLVPGRFANRATSAIMTAGKNPRNPSTRVDGSRGEPSETGRTVAGAVEWALNGECVEELAAGKLASSKKLFGDNAWQEVEVWALAGQDNLPSKWPWQEIRQEIHPKETYFEPHATARGLLDEPGEGRTTMGREAAANYGKVRSRCKEIEDLETRLKNWLEKS